MALGINEQQEAKMISARAARNKQNPKVPFLINVKDGRLMPNVPALAGRPPETQNGKEIPAKKGHPDYRPFTGSVKASLAERMTWLQTMGNTVAAGPRAVSLANLPPFDIGMATIDELVEFAKDEYKADLSKQMGLVAMRKEVVKLAKAAGAVDDDLS